MTAEPGPRNPYRPGVGIKPLYLAGRAKETRRFGASLRSAPEIPANMRLTGLRGVGKTVLLGEFDQAAKTQGWVTLRLELEPRHNTDDTLASEIVSQCVLLQERISRAERIKARMGEAVQAVRSLAQIEWNDMTFSLGGGLPGATRDIAEALKDCSRLALEQGYQGVGLLLDEAQILRDDSARVGNHPLSMLIAGVSALQREGVPLGLVLCGLPTLTVNLLNARTYSERMFKGQEIGSLAPDEALAAFVEPLREGGGGKTASEDLVTRVLEEVDGYPYFLQLWGAELWEAAEEASLSQFSVELLDEVEPDIYKRLDIDFYEPRVQSLTPAEQDLLTDTRACGYPPLLASELARRSPKSVGNVNVLLGRLVSAGVLYRPRKGQYMYTAPKFHDYLKRRSA